MPRVARVAVAGYPYHVINRAVLRLKIFNTDGEYQLFEELLQKTCAQHDMRLLAYAVMPNHWHFLLYPKHDGDLALFMHGLTNAHTRLVKAMTDTNGTGPLYQGRYKSFLIQKDAHLLAVIKYIERNPVRAGLVKRAEDWRWGSAWRRIFGTTEQKKLITEPPVPLPDNYRTWVNAVESAAELDALRISVNKGAPFGSESWVEKTVKQFGLGPTLRNPGRPKK